MDPVTQSLPGPPTQKRPSEGTSTVILAPAGKAVLQIPLGSLPEQYKEASS